MSINSYRELNVWRLAMDVAEAVYLLSRSFPDSEAYGLTSQMRRSAVSIPSNIAEGHGRETSRAYIQSLRIAQGSLKELETQLLLAERAHLATNDTTGPILEKCDQLGRMLRALIRAVQEKVRASD